MGAGAGKTRRVQSNTERVNANDQVYDDAVKLWLIRNNSDLMRLQNRGRRREEGEVLAQVTNVSFGANDSYWISEITFGGEAEPVITFEYKGREYRHELEYIPMGTFIKEVSEIVVELKSK